MKKQKQNTDEKIYQNDFETEEEREALREYGDILFCDRPDSKNHPPLSWESRAAQFSPFSVLDGYEQEIAEAARYTTNKISISDDQKQNINRKLQWLIHRTFQTRVRIIFFQKDPNKEGGNREVIEGIFQKWDATTGKLILKDNVEINVKDLYDIIILDTQGFE
jgi:hypothetical protein